MTAVRNKAPNTQEELARELNRQELERELKAAEADRDSLRLSLSVVEDWRDGLEEDRDREAEAAAMWCSHSMGCAADARDLKAELEHLRSGIRSEVERAKADGARPYSVMRHVHGDYRDRLEALLGDES